MSSAPPASTSTNTAFTPSRIALVTGDLAKSVSDATQQITEITTSSRILSFNARIEAARAGGASGSAFAVVAAEMGNLADSTASVADSMRQKVSGMLNELSRIADHLSSDVRGTRLSDLALNNIDLIDRNLYERSCDCRWWATDSAFVDALANPTPDRLAHASTRMGTILNAYTVYFDLVLADATGRVLANGRPSSYTSVGHDVSRDPWFSGALATASGDDFAFQTAHVSKLVNSSRALIYSAAVREGGQTRGKPLGALGLVFNWDGLAKRVIENTPLEPTEKSKTRITIIDRQGHVLSDSNNQELHDQISFTGLQPLLQSPKSFALLDDGKSKTLVAQGKSPGFETYATGWHCLIQQTLTP